MFCIAPNDHQLSRAVVICVHMGVHCNRQEWITVQEKLTTSSHLSECRAGRLPKHTRPPMLSPEVVASERSREASKTLIVRGFNHKCLLQLQNCYYQPPLL